MGKLAALLGSKTLILTKYLTTVRFVSRSDRLPLGPRAFGIGQPSLVSREISNFASHYTFAAFEAVTRRRRLSAVVMRAAVPLVKFAGTCRRRGGRHSSCRPRRCRRQNPPSLPPARPPALARVAQPGLS